MEIEIIGNKLNKILFALSCTERISGLYKLFDIQNDSDNYEIISSYIEKIYNCIECNEYDYELFKKMSDICVDIAPDTDEYETFEAVIAQNISISLAYVLLYVIESNDKYIEYCVDKIIEVRECIYFNKYGYNENNSIAKEEYLVERSFIQLLHQSVNINQLRDFNKKNMVLFS